MVLAHLQDCEACRIALAHEEQVVRELQLEMPLLGFPKPGRLARLWPNIWAEIQTQGRTDRLGFAGRIQSFSMALVGLLLCALLTSAMLAGPTSVNAAALQALPATAQTTSLTRTATSKAPAWQPTASATAPASGPTIAPAPTTETLPTTNP